MTTWSNVFKLYDLPLTNKKELVENSQVQLTKKLNLATHHINHFAEPIEIEKLAGHYGTPLYIIDENTLHKRVRDLRNAYARFNGHVKLAYSVKANFTPAVLTSFIRDGITFDITSLGELHFLTRCKAPPENMIYTSVTEEFQEYYEVLQSGIRKVVVSSFSGLTNLAKAAHKLAIKPLTMIRVNPEVGVKAEICASYKNGKFGVPLNGGTIDNAAQMVKHLMDNDLLQFEGFHFHLGSQITDFSCFIHAFDKMHNFMTKMKKEFPKFTVNTFDIGGGTPVFYNESVPTPSQMADSYIPRLNRLVESHGPFDLLWGSSASPAAARRRPLSRCSALSVRAAGSAPAPSTSAAATLLICRDASSRRCAGGESASSRRTPRRRYRRAFASATSSSRPCRCTASASRGPSVRAASAS